MKKVTEICRRVATLQPCGITDVWEISSIGSSCAEENDDVQINFLGMLKNVVCYYGHEIINKIKN